MRKFVVRSPKSEVEKILAGLDVHFRAAWARSKLADQGVKAAVYDPLMESSATGRELQEAVRWLVTGLSRFDKGQGYMTHVIQACAHCVSAVRHLQLGLTELAWAKISDARAEAGIALAHYVADDEHRFRANKPRKKGGFNRGKKNEKLKEFVLGQYAAGGYKNPSAGGLAIARRFLEPYGKPELTPEDFGAKLSLDRIDKTFSEWIRLGTKTDGS